MIDKGTVKRILDAADIVDVVSDYVHLTRRGSNYMGLCPFHNERTPSFSVSPARGICHCFSCGKGGSPVNFIMEKEGINFHDALLRLANKYGIKVEERELTDEEREQQSRREAMLTVNEWAMKRFQENLKTVPEGRDIGLKYLYERGITDHSINKFKLGYALDKPTDIYDAATRQGYDIDALKEVGICGLSSNNGRPYDRFRGRVIFPMINTAGKVVAFGGRGIKGEAAKYINSPESDIYHKSNELYGIYQAKNAMVKHKHCFLVEGYMDVIGMWQCGLENTVASSGTSLTEGQVALIHRFAEKITIIYDGDSAGIHASLRAIDMCLAQNLEVTLLLLPDGHDPDSFARENTPEQFRDYVARHELDFISYMKQVLNTGTASISSRTEMLRTMTKSIACVSDLIQRTVYIQRCSSLMDVAENVITREVARRREEVIQAMRKRRQNARIDAEEASEKNTGNTTPSDAVTTAKNNEAFSHSIAARPIIERLEQQVMEYVVRYGMMPFGYSMKPGEEEKMINVVEYVNQELGIDCMQFSKPLFDRMFRKILSMVASHDMELTGHMKAINEIIERENKEWHEEMISKSMDINEIEMAEAARRQHNESRREQEMSDFSSEWIGRALGSDPDDEIRHFTLSAITPRYTLSKYHSKHMHIPSEAERIGELVPRSILEWKAEILKNGREELRKKLSAALDAGNVADAKEIAEEIQEKDEMRKEIARMLGERICEPRRL